jgi:two-component system nitrate/nitrite response regulator NarL
MRLVICDEHVVFAESLAHLLMARGHQVKAVTHHPDELGPALRRESADVCVLDVTFGTGNCLGRLAALRTASPATHFVVLTGDADAAVLAAARAAGVRGVADKRQPMDALLTMLTRVADGEWVITPERVRPVSINSARRHANDAQRLASYLTGRERQVLCHLVLGADTTKVARSMSIASATARCHIQNVLTKLGAHSRLEAATSAVRHGMVSPDTGAWLLPGGPADTDVRAAS